MDELIRLEEAGCDITDSAVSADAAKSTLAVELLARATDLEAALSVALSSICSAFHATGGQTSVWPEVVLTEQRAELVAV